MHLWRRKRGQGGAHEWVRAEIPAGGLSLSREERGLALGAEAAPGSIARLVPFTAHGIASVALVLAPEISHFLVNGYPPLAVTVLDQRAELNVEGELLYYSALGPSGIARLSEAEPAIRCARCRRRLAAGDTVRCCGVCAAPHHEGPRADENEPPLWCASYDPECAGCKRRWEECAWTPEEDGHA